MECFLWSKLGQAPWSDIHAQWYHRLPSTSLGALEGAAQLKEYTITDRETWLSADRSVRDAMAIFVGLKFLQPKANGSHSHRKLELINRRIPYSSQCMPCSDRNAATRALGTNFWTGLLGLMVRISSAHFRCPDPLSIV